MRHITKKIHSIFYFSLIIIARLRYPDISLKLQLATIRPGGSYDDNSDLVFGSHTVTV